MDNTLVIIVGFLSLFGLMALRVPIGIAMGIVGTVGFAVLNDIEPALRLVSHSPITILTSYSMGLIPLFIFMGSVATATGMSQELFRAGEAWLGHFRGGLAMGTIAACGGFAAICGSSVATAATMTKLALPEMRRIGYSDSMATGVIAVGGTLGILIPPSIGLAVYGLIVQQDIGMLFIAGILPGIIAILMYTAGIRIFAWARPNMVPAGDAATWSERWRSLQGIWAVILLFLFVIGGIYGGVFTPTEAGGIGAAGAVIIGIARGRLSFRVFMRCLTESVRTSAAILLILVGAILFGYFLTITRTPQVATEALLALELGKYGTLAVILAIFLLLGCFIDTMAVVVLMVPIAYPIIVNFGFDPIWFGVIVVLTVEVGMISPPIGLNVFVINSIAKDIPLWTIFRGVGPFIFIDLLKLILLIAVPSLVLILPRTMAAF